VIGQPVELIAATGPAVAEPTASEAEMSHAVPAEAGTLLAEAPVDSTERTRAPLAAAAPQAWGLEAAEASVAAVAEVAGVDNRLGS
jgi:hypothetical protein